MTTRTPPALPPELEALAKEHFGFETLETRNSDRLDFREVSVGSVRVVLQRAFELGQAAATGKQPAGKA